MILGEELKGRFERLFAFLLKEGILLEYIYNVEYADKTDDEEYTDFLSAPLLELLLDIGGYVKESEIIENSFLWKATPQKEDFWEEVDLRWKDECSKR